MTHVTQSDACVKLYAYSLCVLFVMANWIWIMISSAVSSNDLCEWVCVLWQSRWVNTGGGRHCGLDVFNWSVRWRRPTQLHPPSAICGVADTFFFLAFFFLLTRFYKALDIW